MDVPFDGQLHDVAVLQAELGGGLRADDAALSHTSFVIGSGSSCSHGFMANRPSSSV